MTEPIFVESPVKVYRGDEAAARLAQTNDSAYLSENGIVSVPVERWLKAHEYERETWLVHNLDATDDRSAEHAAGFDGYKALPPNLGSVLELGCGVFTVTRSIMEWGHMAEHVTLVDPLAAEYQRHPHCAYKDNQIGGILVYVDASTIEGGHYDTPYPLFDTVILVNTVSHCQNAKTVFDVAWSRLNPGGIFVFQETVHPVDPQNLYDVGHPLRVSQAYVDEFLSRFEALYRGENNYFIGQKPGLTAEPVEEKPKKGRPRKK